MIPKFFRALCARISWPDHCPDRSYGPVHGLIITSSGKHRQLLLWDHLSLNWWCVTAFPCVKMVCNVSDFQGLCPSDNKPRMCTCVVTTGDRLIWSTTLQPGVCSPAPSISFSSADPIEHSSAVMGFTAELTNNTEGQLTSILIFTPSAVLASGIESVYCNNGNTADCDEQGKTLTVAYSGITTCIVHLGNTSTGGGGWAWADFLTKSNYCIREGMN